MKRRKFGDVVKVKGQGWFSGADKGESCRNFMSGIYGEMYPTRPYQRDFSVIASPVPIWSGLLHVCEQQLHYQGARASSRLANAPPEWKLAGLTSRAKGGICICLTAPVIQICPQLERWRPGQRPASDLCTLLSPRSVPSCCLCTVQAEPPWTPSTVILQSPSTLWLLCQQLDTRPGSAGLWSLEPAGLQARELPDVCANKWQELLCNYHGTEISREIISPTGFGIQSNRGSKLLFVCEVELVTGSFCSGLSPSWNEALFSSLRGEGFKSRLSSTWYLKCGLQATITWVLFRNVESGPTPDLLNQNLIFNKISRGFACLFGKPWPQHLWAWGDSWGLWHLLCTFII